MSGFAKQGHGDGFCGIYCLANALSKWEILKTYPDWRREGFRRLIMAAERLNLLDSYHLIEGYEDHELTEIFNFMSERYECPWIAKRVESFKPKPSGQANIAFVRSILENDASVIFTVENGSHWILATHTCKNDKIAVVDPWPNSNRGEVGAVKSLSEGVVIYLRNNDV